MQVYGSTPTTITIEGETLTIFSSDGRTLGTAPRLGLRVGSGAVVFVSKVAKGAYVVSDYVPSAEDDHRHVGSRRLVAGRITYLVEVTASDAGLRSEVKLGAPLVLSSGPAAQGSLF